MAHLHFHRTVYKMGGSASTTRVAYITRQPSQELDRAKQQLRYLHRADREDLVYTQSRNLPAWAGGKAHTYFHAAEQYERANGNAFEEWKITLPQELTPRQNMDLMRDLVETIAGNRLPITYAFHSPKTMDSSQAQPHLHLLISGRQSDGIARTPERHFKRYNATHPERGGAPKDPALYHKQAVKQWRVTISDVVNLHLERAGLEDRLHPDSLKDRELVRTPEPKLYPSESRAYRDDGVVTARMQKVLDVRAQRKDTQQAEQANARAYWQERKTVLGLTEGMDGTAALAAVCTARALVRDHAPAKAVVLGAVGVEVDDRALGDLAREAYADAWGAAQGVWQQGQAEHEAQAREQARAWTSLEEALQDLTQQLDGLSTDEGRAGDVRIRLWDREQGLSM